MEILTISTGWLTSFQIANADIIALPSFYDWQTEVKFC